MANHLSKVPRFAGFGKEGRGEIFQCLCQFNFETLNKLSDSYLKIQSTVGAATVSTPKVYDESYRNRAGTQIPPRPPLLKGGNCSPPFSKGRLGGI